MAKKQFIRHLEFYGFPDQNSYSSDVSGVDLSGIIEKNKEQDKEISDLEGEKADEEDLLELSGTVETLISAQTDFNTSVVDALSSITSDIDSLMEVDNEFGEQISALTDGVNDALSGITEINNELEEVNNDVDTLIEDVEDLNNTVESFSAETESALTEIEEALDDKLDKDEASETYARADEVPTIEEIGTMLEDYATIEWVSTLGYITEEQGNQLYAKKDDFDALSSTVSDNYTNLTTRVDELSGKVESLSSDTINSLTAINDGLNTISAKVETVVDEMDEVSSEMDIISGMMDSLSSLVGTYDDRINAIDSAVQNKADESGVTALSERVDEIAASLNDKVNTSDFEAYKVVVTNITNSLDDRKADKSSISAISGSIDAVDEKIDNEISARESGDAALDDKIEAISGEIITIKEKNVGYDEDIQDLNDRLAQEILDRTNGDIDLIGTEDDIITDDTIWGAKKYSENQKNIAISQSRDYADGLKTIIDGDIEQLQLWAEQNFSSGATKQYVNDMVNDAKSTLSGQITTEVGLETSRASGAERDLLTRIVTDENRISTNDTAITNLANKVNAITSWDGTDPYSDSGNGVLDVTHHELHSLINKLKELGVLPSDWNP